MASLNWLRLAEVLRSWRFLQSIEPSPPLLYLAISGLVWGIIGTALVWGLFLGSSWAPWLMRIAAPLYAAAYWVDRLLVADPQAAASLWPFSLGLTVILLAFTFFVLSRPKAGRFYQKPSS